MRNVLLFALLAGAAATDWKRHKIYNRWTFPGLLAGVAAAGVLDGADGIRCALCSAIFALVLLFPVYLIGGIGAGDVKLFAAAASFLELRETFLCIFVSFLIGAGFSLLLIVAKKGKQRQIRFALPILISILFVSGGKL
ncbi:MAG: A24 family peptidase [Lachnospiraceae bacterium]|nr:A24 family peptidase [Lachnospiraceae bacterium]